MSMAQALIAEIRNDPQALEELWRLIAPMVKAVREQGQPDEWFDTKGAAEYLGISVNALHKYTSARTIPFHQEVPGGKCWLRRSEVDLWRSGR